MASAAVAGRESSYLPGPRRRLAPPSLPAFPATTRERLRLGARALLCLAAAVGGCGLAAVDPAPPLGVGCGLALVALGAAALGIARGAGARAALQREVEDRTHELWHALAELEVAQAETVRKLSMAVEFRDEATGAHIERIGRLAALLAERLGYDQRYCARIFHAAPLHDVGKVAIPDAVLLKPGPLTPQERAVVQAHAEEGYRLLSCSSSSILEMAATIALTHHERWDGSGYPRGLRGEEIPLEGRIVAVCDVFDALTSDRVYRKAYSLEEALAVMRSQRGSQFDPVVLDAFLAMVGGRHAPLQDRLPVAALGEVFCKALESGDSELAEGVIAQAVEDGIEVGRLHGELVAPAIRRIYALRAAGALDLEGEQRAQGIAKRVLATLFRSIAAGSSQDREPVLLATAEGEQRTVELQMAHDQLAAAGFRVTLVTDLAPERLKTTVETARPRLVFVAASTPALAPAAVGLCEELVRRWPTVPVLVGGYAARAVEGRRLPVITVDPIERCLDAVESLLPAAV
jgi:methanogenic corrinoid protein MtbC1